MYVASAESACAVCWAWRFRLDCERIALVSQVQSAITNVDPETERPFQGVEFWTGIIVIEQAK